MTDKYLVVIFEEDSELSPEDADIYDIGEMWLQGDTHLPEGVYVEEWYVKSTESPESSPAYNAHSVLNRTVKLLSWSELGLPERIKDKEWWEQKKKVLTVLYKTMKMVTTLAIDQCNDVLEVIDDDQRTLEEAMQEVSHWMDYDTLGHWLEMTEKTIEEWDRY